MNFKPRSKRLDPITVGVVSVIGGAAVGGFFCSLFCSSELGKKIKLIIVIII